MSYFSTIDGQPGRRPRRRLPLPARGAHAKFTRLEPLESRLLFAGLDPLFGVGGRSRIDVANFADAATALHVLADGKILVAGSATFGLGTDLLPIQRAFVARLNADGSLDGTFGEAGVATTAPPPEGPGPAVVYPRVVQVDSLAVGPGGRIFVGGTSATNAVAGSTPATTPDDPDFAVAAFSADGVPDLSFGLRGVTHYPVLQQPRGGEESVDAMAVQPDGAVVATGAVRRRDENESQVATVRFTATGNPDLEFGVKLLPLAGDRASFTTDAAVALQSDGKVVAMGKATQIQAATFVLGRYLADGTPDATFGDNGRVVTPVRVPPFAGADAPGGFCDVLVQADGSVVAAAKTGYFEVTVVRYTPAGAPDAGFGGDAVVEVRGTYGNAGDLRHEADGSYAVAVVHNHPSGTHATNSTSASTLSASSLSATRPVAGLPRLSVVNPQGFSAYVARLGSAGQVLSEARMSGSDVVGVEGVYAAEIRPDGKLLAVGNAYPTASSGEGPAWAQTADALVVRLDPARFDTTPTPPAGDTPPTPTDPPAVPGGPNVYVVDGIGPVPLPSFAGKNSVARGRFYQFKLYFQTAEQARAVPVGIFGPAGHVAQAQLTKVRTAKGRIQVDAARPAVATYKAPAPGGKFDAGDNGTYAIRLGTADPAGPVVGQFTVNAKARKGGATTPLRRLVVSATPAAAPAESDPAPSPLPRNFHGKPTVRKGEFYTFTLDYAHESLARTSPVGLYGPGGLVAAAELLDVRETRGNPQRTFAVRAVATYRAPAPGGSFDASDNGLYAVRLGTAEPLGAVVGEFRVAAKAPRAAATAGRQFTGVLRGDLDRIAAQWLTQNWRLERPGGGVLALDVSAVSADAPALVGQRVTVTGTLKKLLPISPLRVRTARILVVTSIRAAAP